MMELISQVGIVILGGISIYYLAKNSPSDRFRGHVAGLLAEPMWLYTAATNDQWGICISAIWWGVFYALGAFRCWKDMRQVV